MGNKELYTYIVLYGVEVWTIITVEIRTERGGSVVTHETPIREVPGSNSVDGQPD